MQETTLKKDKFDERMHLLEREVEWLKDNNNKIDKRFESLETYL